MLLFVFIISLCIGSFLNVLAYRILHEKNFWAPRSMCPSCNHVIAWYDNIPVISWLFLRGQCRACKAPISCLYPFTELMTGVTLTALFYKLTSSPTPFAFCAYAIFFCALIAATRTDLEAMVIPQLFSIWLAPLGVLASYAGLTDISWHESMIGCMFGYGILWAIAALFKRLTRKDGMGVGDMELLALIGSFMGPFGVWISLMVGSLSGFVIGGAYVFATRKKEGTRIPFGPFLALGALIYFFFKPLLTKLLLGL